MVQIKAKRIIVGLKPASGHLLACEVSVTPLSASSKNILAASHKMDRDKKKSRAIVFLNCNQQQLVKNLLSENV